MPVGPSGPLPQVPVEMPIPWTVSQSWVRLELREGTVRLFTG